MIGRLRGTVGYKAEDHALIDVGGVGYVVYCSTRTLSALPAPGGAALVYTELLVREDLLQLFGFSSVLEREWHRLLTRAPGVGSKVSLAILGALGPEGVSRAIALGDANALRRAPGVGPKLAQRIANELKDKAPAVMAMGAAAEPELVEPDDDAVDPAPPSATAAPRKKPSRAKAAEQQSRQAQADALSALVNLQYQQGEAAAAIAQAAEAEPGLDAANLIRAALRLLAPKE